MGKKVHITSSSYRTIVEALAFARIQHKDKSIEERNACRITQADDLRNKAAEFESVRVALISAFMNIV